MMYLPEQNTSRHCVIAIAESMKLLNRDGSILPPLGVGGALADKKWKKVFQPSAGWVDVWTTPIAAVSVTYTYHPMPPLKEAENPADFPVNFPTLLAPLRPLRPKKRLSPPEYGETMTNEANFNPTCLTPDEIRVEIEVGPSVAFAYGSLVRNFLHLKENYFGEDQKIFDFEKTDEEHGEKGTTSTTTFENVMSSSESRDKLFDARRYRPLHVKVQLTLHDLQAHLVRNCLENAAPCPCVFAERLGFELDKKYEETMLQVILSPAVLVARDISERPSSHSHLSSGHLALSGLQIRGHAMFSHEGLPLDSETLEYAWLLEVTVGDLTGRLTAPQLQNIVEFLQTFL